MQPHNETASPEPHHPEINRRWGCSIALLILVLVASFVMWDLYPIWGQTWRLKKLHKIAQPGKHWTKIEPILAVEGFLVAPPDLTSLFEKRPNSRLILLTDRSSIVADSVVSLAMAVGGLDALNHVHMLVNIRLALIELSSKDEVENLRSVTH